jgi:hypothetical protein
MPARKSVSASSLSHLSQRFVAWRNKRVKGERIPASLWNAAVQMAEVHGVNHTARTLQLDYYSLKKRMGNASNGLARSAFVELPASVLPAANECLIEWEDRAGGRMRMHVKGPYVPDVIAMSRCFWGAD